VQERDVSSGKDRFTSPPCECDIVMKGGITSGVVYPQAVLRLAQKYRFRAIGGGSVGALVAALTAAAERARGTGGFERLDEKRDELSSDGFISSRFQAPEQTRPALEFFLAILSAKNEAASRASRFGSYANHLGSVLIREYRKVFVASFVVGAILGIVLLSLLAKGLKSPLSEADLSSYMILFGFVVGLLAAACGAIAKFVHIMWRKVPKNQFGLCRGSGAPGTAEQPLLTDWMSQAINYIAGVEVEGAPLTFADLQSADDVNRRMELKIMTTNLNQTTPYIFPRKPNTFLFREDEMSAFFPDNVVQYMIDNPAPKHVDLPEGFHVFPEANKLPIVVPVRMAISFPILLSAVPVWTVKRAAWNSKRMNQPVSLAETDLIRNVFSDGGICSNFPIHFFDAWLPKRPTFGINLTSIPDENDDFILDDISSPSPSGDLDPNEVWLPQADQRDNILSSRIGNLLQFAMAIFHSAQNFRDTMQSQLPSYQERVVNVPLSSLEGGLNLNMPMPVIEGMQDKGLEAGEILCGERFSFERHQWVRLRVLMGLLKKNLSEMEESLNMETSEDPCKVKKYSEILRTVDADFPFYPVGWNNQVADTIADTLEGLEALLDGLSDAETDTDFFKPVSPYEIRPELRIAPDL
jgi:predicted acylesterase/phospholipase RssA